MAEETCSLRWLVNETLAPLEHKCLPQTQFHGRSTVDLLSPRDSKEASAAAWKKITADADQSSGVIADNLLSRRR